jgi:diguanylate cyclase (GGDEF)-like protein/PAS domain S-box-containing protein
MDKRDYRGSIQKRLIYIILSVTSVVVLFGYSIFIIWYIDNQQTKSIELSKTISKVLSQDLAKLVLLNDVSSASDITTKLKAFKSITSLVLFNIDKKAIYKYVRKTQKSTQRTVSEKNLKINMPVEYMGTPLGSLELHIEIASVIDILKNDFLPLLIMSLFMVVFSYILSIVNARKFTRPIIKLVRSLENIHFDKPIIKRLKHDKDDEFGKLYDEVNLMLDRIENFISFKKIASVAFETQSGMVITDKEMKVLQVNNAYIDITGYNVNDVLGKKVPVLSVHLENDRVYKEIEKSLNNKHYWQGEIKNIKKDGSIFYEHLIIQDVCNDNNEVTNFVLSFIDITKQKEDQNKLAYLMQYDSITGLGNKTLFLEALQKDIDNCNKDIFHSLIFFDIKDFNTINEIYGYQIGDLVLKELANRLKKYFKDNDFIAKVGSDEFLLSYRDLNADINKAFEFTQTTLKYLENVLSESFIVENKVINLNTRIGVNIYSSKIKDADVVLKQTSSAIKEAKQKDKKIVYFDEELQIKTQQTIDIYSQLLIASRNDEFELYYQFQYDLNRNIYGAEALIRWNHPEKGLLTPYYFIDIAERTGLILDIGLWVLNEGCKQLSLWNQDEKTSKWTLSINVSAKQFAQDDFIQQVKDAVLFHKIDPKNLKIELVESMLVDDLQKTIDKMKALRELGVQISMDDFGTGYSSLEYLKNLPLNQIKIDQSFIFNMLNDNKDKAIVKAMIELGKAFDFDVIAEGVETEDIYKKLKEMGCFYYQGYYFAKPQSIK